MIRSVRIRGFRSIVDQVFEPGSFNVLIGANGSGKSAILEALGVLGAALEGRVNDNSLQRRGVRLSAPEQYASAFPVSDEDAAARDIELSARFANGTSHEYTVRLAPPPSDAEFEPGAWRFDAEFLHDQAGHPLILRARDAAAFHLLENDWNQRLYEIEKVSSMAAMFRHLGEPGARDVQPLFDTLRRFVIYDPQTPVLRGTIQDVTQQDPIGLQGGRLAEAVKAVLSAESVGAVPREAITEWIDWASDLRVVASSEVRVSPSVPVTPEVLRFTDRFLDAAKNTLSGYDASEGALYVLFALVLVFHPRTPPFFAVEHLDHALHPRLAKRLVATLADHAAARGKQIILTTHNPLVLDGLDLANDAVRLFAVDRSVVGHTLLQRIQYTDALKKAQEHGLTLSQMWVRGLLGAVPEIV
jgi:predicted ATPase